VYVLLRAFGDYIQSFADPAKQAILHQSTETRASVDRIIAEFKDSLKQLLGSSTGQVKPDGLRTAVVHSASHVTAGKADLAPVQSGLLMDIEKRASAVLPQLQKLHMQRQAQISAAVVVHMATLGTQFSELVTGALTLDDDVATGGAESSGGTTSTDVGTVAAEDAAVDWISVAKQEATELRAFYSFFNKELSDLCTQFLSGMEQVVSEAANAIHGVQGSPSSASSVTVTATAAASQPAVTAGSSSASGKQALASSATRNRQVEKLRGMVQSLKMEMYIDVSNANSKLQVRSICAVIRVLSRTNCSRMPLVRML